LPAEPPINADSLRNRSASDPRRSRSLTGMALPRAGPFSPQKLFARASRDSAEDSWPNAVRGLTGDLMMGSPATGRGMRSFTLTDKPFQPDSMRLNAIAPRQMLGVRFILTITGLRLHAGPFRSCTTPSAGCRTWPAQREQFRASERLTAMGCRFPPPV
jgi:hypothetical protein